MIWASTVGETLEAGGHPQSVKAVYNGEADVGTAYFSPPLLPEGRWELGMAPDIPDELVPDCALNEEGKLYCGDYRVLDARAAIAEEAPDVVQKVRILALSAEIPNDTMSFSPDFPEDLQETHHRAWLRMLLPKLVKKPSATRNSMTGLQLARSLMRTSTAFAS